MEYKIILFDESQGQLKIQVDGFSPIAIDVPIVDGKFIEGEELESHIKGFIPVWEIQRRETLKKGVENASAISSLVQPPSKAVEVEKTPEQKLEEIRFKRNQLLFSCDWTQLPDSPLSTEQKTAWAEYRAALRSLPENFSTLEEIVFPEAPLKE